MVEKAGQKLASLAPKGTKPEALLREIHSFEGKIAGLIADLSGSIIFVYIHTVWFGFWILANQGFFKPYIYPFDPFPYGLLTMVVSLEAIFLSTFILINQNRQALLDIYRDIEEEQEQQEEEQEQQELEEEVEDIQKDLDDIKKAIIFIQQKIGSVEKNKKPSGGNGGSTGIS